MQTNKRQQLADAFGREIDPLAAHAATLEEVGIDVFELFVEDVLEPKDLSEDTLISYERTIRQWSEYMEEQGRHPACPNEEHVKGFLRREVEERGNAARTARKKLTELNRIYEYWQNGAEFPHPTDFNPFGIAKEKVDLTTERVKEPPRIPVETLRERIARVTNVRQRALIVTQLKLGIRATEMANIKLSEVNLINEELREHYPNLGTSPHVSDYSNAVYIPHDREGNKRRRPTVLPLDDELRRLWITYLLMRPDNGEPWLFLSHTSNTQLDDEAVNLAWKDAFHPEYAETETHRGVTSHFGRHRFTTYWRVEEGINEELIKYMRGDVEGDLSKSTGAIKHYIHSYYEDIEDLYRKRIYKLGV